MSLSPKKQGCQQLSSEKASFPFALLSSQNKQQQHPGSVRIHEWTVIHERIIAIMMIIKYMINKLIIKSV